jgi:methylated-DNA-[protein]-cysteine S-methyltransferase
MKPTRFTLLDTAIGRCGIAWNDRGLVGVQLPETSVAATRARMQQRFPEATETRPDAQVRPSLTAIAQLLAGKRRDLSSIALDMQGVPPFHQRVYQAARKIPPGHTVTYGELAAQLGSPGSARAVGQAMGRNPFAIVVPCHRVLAAGGKLGGFSANGGIETKRRMLTIEGTPPPGPPPPRSAAAPRKRELAPAHGLAFDPARAIAHVREVEPALAKVIDAVGSFDLRVDPAHSLFSALSRAIVYQQLNGTAAATILGRVRALFPGAPALTPQHILGAAEDKLRGAGLSRSKLLALQDLARRTAAGELPTLARLQRMEDEEIIERLTEVRGIGRWTVQMLLIFRLGRPDVLAVDDYGVRQGFALTFRKRQLPAPRDLEARGARWAPYRTVASWYFWRAVELHRQSKARAAAG